MPVDSDTEMIGTGQPHVSIVTPVFNEEKHLAECIESVLAQTYPHWDFTIVDNCSTDNSSAIAEAFAKKDSRIRVQRNRAFLRALQNCNVAVRQISPAAKYCKVVLADDWIYPECLERMVALAEAHPSIGIVGAFSLEGTRVALSGLPYDTQILSGREACRRHLLEGLHIFGTQNSVLYRADLVRQKDPFYNESNIHADTEVCFELLKNADFGFIHQVLTFTRVRPGSLYATALALETPLASTLHLLTTHAPEFLSRDEIDAAIEQHLREYYRFLGKSLLLNRTRDFWEFHKQQLVASGFGFSRRRLLSGLVSSVIRATAKPGVLVSSVGRRLGR